MQDKHPDSTNKTLIEKGTLFPQPIDRHLSLPQ
jgi:hypothetical protein